MSFRFKKQRRSDDSHAGLDDWLMTYADMITLLLCFFAVFLSVSVPKKDVFKEAKEKMLEQFSDPGLGGRFPVIESTPSKSGGVYDAQPSFIDRYHSGQGQSVGEGVDAGEGQSEGFGEGTQQHQGRRKEDDESLDAYGAPEGDRLTTIEMPSAAFFASGSAELMDDGKRLLEEILETKLKASIAQGYQVNIEGHTDDVPINTLQFPSNWELSTARAAAVVRFLLEKGVDPQHVSASGYADVFPKAPNRDESGNPIAENRAQNRRVVLKLEKIERAR